MGIKEKFEALPVEEQNKFYDKAADLVSGLIWSGETLEQIFKDGGIDAIALHDAVDVEEVIEEKALMLFEFVEGLK